MMQISTVILNRTKPNQLILYPKSLKTWMLITDINSKKPKVSATAVVCVCPLDAYYSDCAQLRRKYLVSSYSVAKSACAVTFAGELI